MTNNELDNIRSNYNHTVEVNHMTLSKNNNLIKELVKLERSIKVSNMDVETYLYTYFSQNIN